MLLVTCIKNHKLGHFAPADDHGSILVYCNKCKKMCEVFNSDLMDVLDHPNDYEPNDRIIVRFADTE